MSTNEALRQKTIARIHSLPDGKILGAVLWIPSWFIEKHITRPGQEEIEVSFKENQIIMEKEDDIGALMPTTPGIRQEPSNISIVSQ